MFPRKIGNEIIQIESEILSEERERVNWSSGRGYKYRYQGVGKMALQIHDHRYVTGPRVSCIRAEVSFYWVLLITF